MNINLTATPPVASDHPCPPVKTLRDEFAMVAMGTLLGNPFLPERIDMARISKEAYRVADFMIKEKGEK